MRRRLGVTEQRLEHARVHHRVVHGAARRQRHEQERHAARHDLHRVAGAGDGRRRQRQRGGGARGFGDRRRRKPAGPASSTRSARSSPFHVSDTGVGPAPRPNTNEVRPRSMTPAARQRERRSDRRMAGGGSSSPGVKMRKRTSVPSLLARQHERRLREVHLLRDRLHRVGGQTASVEEHGELVAAEEVIGEDVVMQIAVGSSHVVRAFYDERGQLHRAAVRRGDAEHRRQFHRARRRVEGMDRSAQRPESEAALLRRHGVPPRDRRTS